MPNTSVSSYRVIYGRLIGPSSPCGLSVEQSSRFLPAPPLDSCNPAYLLWAARWHSVWHCCLTVSGTRVRLPAWVTVRSLHVLPMSAWVSSGCSGFLPQSKDVLGRCIGHAKFSLGVPEQAPECGDWGIFTVTSLQC